MPARRTGFFLDLAKVSVVIGVIVGIFSLAEYVDLKLPRWAWAQELEDTNEDLKDLSQEVIELKLDAKQLQYFQNQRDIYEYTEQNLVPPPFLLEEKSKLERAIERLNEELE